MWLYLCLTFLPNKFGENFFGLFLGYMLISLKQQRNILKLKAKVLFNIAKFLTL